VRLITRKISARLSTRRRSRYAAPAVLLAALFASGGLYTALAPANANKASDDAATIAKGKALFAVSCASCHGKNAEGIVTAKGNQYGPSLVGVGAAAVDFQVSTGRMPLQHHGAQAPRKRPSFDERQTQQLAAYVQSLAPGPKIPNVDGWEKTDVAFGGALFRTNCAQCHNFVGAGGALTYGRYAPALTNATPTQIYEAMITGPENMPVFGEKTITPAQKLAIINYVKTVQHEANPGGAGLGRIGPVSETLVGIIVGLGLAVLATLWLGTRA
jgi:ubiquinol-cytochrome c reductase cytochrome c subunit